jgi:hypothetical protein
MSEQTVIISLHNMNWFVLINLTQKFGTCPAIKNTFIRHKKNYYWVRFTHLQFYNWADINELFTAYSYNQIMFQQSL